MTITLRATKGTPLTHTELDANFTDLNTNKASLASLAASSGSSLVGTIQSGTGAVSEDLQSKLRRDLPSVFDFMSAAQKADAISGALAVDQTTAFQRAGDALQAGSIRGLVVPRYSYLLYKNGVTYSQAPITLSSLTGVTIFWDSPTIQLDTARSWLGANANLISATNVNDFFNIGGFYMTGPSIALDGTFTGVVALHLSGDCLNIITPAMRIDKAFAAIILDSPTVTGVTGIKVQPIDATACIYGINGANSGSNMVVENLVTSGCGRSFFMYGVSNLDARITSTNPKFSADASVSTNTGGATLGGKIRIKYTNLNSTSCGAATVGVLVNFAASDTVVGTIDDVEIDATVKYGGSGQLGSAVVLEKLKGDGSLDTVGRGHTLKRLVINANLDGVPQSGAPIAALATWTSSDSIYSLEANVRLINNTTNNPSLNLKACMPAVKGTVKINSQVPKAIDLFGSSDPATYLPTSTDARLEINPGTRCNNLDEYATASIIGIRSILANSSPVTVVDFHREKTINNYGAGGTVTYNLPAALAGMEFTFARVNAQTMRADPNGTEFITGGGAGKYLSIDSTGGSATLRCTIPGQWEMIRSNGTTSFEA